MFVALSQRKRTGTITICFTWLSYKVTECRKGKLLKSNYNCQFSLCISACWCVWISHEKPLRLSFMNTSRTVSSISVWWHGKCRKWHIIFCLGTLPKQQRNVMRAVGSHHSTFYEKNSQRPESLFLSVSAVTLRKSEHAVNHLGSSMFWSGRLLIASVIL